MKKVILLSFLIISALPLLAQERGYIDVYGQAEKRTKATTMMLGIVIEGKAMEAQQAQQEVLSRSQQVVAFLNEKTYVSEITTETLQLNYQDYNDREARFQARQRITLNVNDLSAYNQFIVELINAGVTQYHTMGFSVQNQESFSKELIALAFKNARAKAEVMAAQAGKEVGEAVIISDQANFDNQPGPIMADMKSSSSAPSMGETIMQMTQMVYVRFLLK